MASQLNLSLMFTVVYLLFQGSVFTLVIRLKNIATAAATKSVATSNRPERLALCSDVSEKNVSETVHVLTWKLPLYHCT